MSKSWRLLRFSLGQLLAGRRLIIVVLLVALPLVLPAVFAAGANVDPATFTLDLFRQLVLPVLLPVVALTFSTSSLGSELRDGTVTNLILKPIPRPAVLGAKYLAAVLAAFICAAPFLWSLVTAFKQNRDLYNPDNNPFFFNLAATPDHVLYLLRQTAFLTFVWNTLWVGLLVVAITLAVLSAIANFLFIPYYPFWSLLIIAVDVFVIWALVAHGRDVAV